MVKQQKPFAGITVLDFSRVLAGPFCSAILADQGAQIIKVEPPQGDDQRYMGAVRNNQSINFQLFNRNKRSLKLDLRQPEAVKIAQELALKADVVLENFRPGVADRLGIGAEQLQALKPDLVYCSVSGFGQQGPMAAMPSYDVVAQALSGMMSVTGEASGAPTLVGDSIGDIVSGIYAAQAISAALYRRSVTGQGARIDVAMFDTLFSLLPTVLAGWQGSGNRPARFGNQHPLSAPFGAFAASDAPFILAVANKALFARLAEALGKPHLADDPRFASDQLRSQNRDALQAEIEDWSRHYTASEVVEKLGKAGLPVSEIWSVDEAAQSAHAQHRQLLHEVEHPQLGKLLVPEQPVHFDGLPRGDIRQAPELGADGADILREFLNMDETQISALTSAGIV